MEFQCPLSRDLRHKCRQFRVSCMTAVALDRRPGSQKKNRSLYWRQNGAFLHVSSCSRSASGPVSDICMFEATHLQSI